MMVLHQTSCVVFTIRRTDSLSAGVLAPKKTIHGLSIEWSLSRDGTTKRPLMTSLFVRGQTRSRWRNCQDCVPCVCSSAEEMKRWIKYEERDNPNVTKRYKEAGGGGGLFVIDWCWGGMPISHRLPVYPSRRPSATYQFFYFITRSDRNFLLVGFVFIDSSRRTRLAADERQEAESSTKTV
jgi:hypothetical protein